MLTINVVTLFPEVFQAALAVSIPGRAAERGLARYHVLQLRDYTHDRHHTVDDSPYGGGAGMVLKPEPFFEAVEDLRAGPPIVLLSARGRPFTHDDAVRFSLGRELTLLCGHYKDGDQRGADGLGAEELSRGDFVLSGGEPAALCGSDAVGRLRPAALRGSTPPSPCARSRRAWGWSASSRCTRPPSPKSSSSARAACVAPSCTSCDGSRVRRLGSGRSAASSSPRRSNSRRERPPPL